MRLAEALAVLKVKLSCKAGIDFLLRWVTSDSCESEKEYTKVENHSDFDK